MKFAIVVVLAVIAITIYIIGMRWCRKVEEIAFNKGVCPECGGELKCVDTDSLGSRYWVCENRYSKEKPCGYECWISYKVDKDKIMEIKKQNNNIES